MKAGKRLKKTLKSRIKGTFILRLKGRFYKVNARVIVGAISGYLAYALGWTQEAIAAWFATTGIIVWIEYGLKTFVRRLSTTQRLKLFSN